MFSRLQQPRALVCLASSSPHPLTCPSSCTGADVFPQQTHRDACLLDWSGLLEAHGCNGLKGKVTVRQSRWAGSDPQQGQGNQASGAHNILLVPLLQCLRHQLHSGQQATKRKAMLWEGRKKQTKTNTHSTEINATTKELQTAREDVGVTAGMSGINH